MESNVTTGLKLDEGLNPSNESQIPRWEENITLSTWTTQIRNEPWIIPLIVLSTFNIIIIVFFEIYVLYKSCGNRRHLFLGQILLLGLFLCSSLGFVFVPEPHWVTCLVIRAGVGITYAVVFATLLVKCVFLLNLHMGLYLKSCYQGLLLFFIVAVQVVIAVQWLFYYPPELLKDAPRNRTREFCKVSPTENVKYLSYVMFLILLVVIACIRARGLRENNKEAFYIGLTMILVVPMWVAWVSVSLIFGRMYSDPAEGFGLVLIATVIFFLVFVPKAVQLGQSHRSSADRISSGSHSVYTPSFFHLQPHAVLPSNQGTLVKQTFGTDYHRAQPSRFLRYDYTSPYQMAPHSNGFTASDLSSTRKPNVTFAHSPLY